MALTEGALLVMVTGLIATLKHCSTPILMLLVFLVAAVVYYDSYVVFGVPQGKVLGNARPNLRPSCEP